MPNQAGAATEPPQDSTPHTSISTVITDIQAALSSFSALAAREFIEALQAAPKLVIWQVFMILAAVIFWISLCVSISAATYVVSHSAFLAIAGLLLPQVLFIAGLGMAIKRAKHALSFPYTRQAIREVMKNQETP